jgi:TolA-binding protein
MPAVPTSTRPDRSRGESTASRRIEQLENQLAQANLRIEGLEHGFYLMGELGSVALRQSASFEAEAVGR